LFQFFCGFCFITNGGYLSAGSLIGAGDAGDILRNGSTKLALILFGIPAIAIGLWLWNGLGAHFGLGPTPKPIDRRVAVGLAGILLVLAVFELWFSRG